MAGIINIIILLVTVTKLVRSNPVRTVDDYMAARAKVINKELCLRIGNKLVLNPQERILNAFIMKEKSELIDESRLNRTRYMPAASFYISKPWMEATPIFKIIKAMPKGAALHLHVHAIASLDWFVNNATYRDNVYMCVDKDYFIILSVFKTPPANPDCEWKLVKTERNAAKSVEEFDRMLKRNLSLLATDPLVTYPSVNQVWWRFNKYFAQTSNFVRYLPILKDYYRQVLKECKEDNVQYIELRGSMSKYYDLNGTLHDTEFGLQLIKQLTEEFVRENPDFSGAKMIMTSSRYKKKEVIMEDIKLSMKLIKKYPDFFVGHDLVAQEGPNNPLIYYIEGLLYPSLQNPPERLPYYFHAGETKWQGTDVDYNLVDAVLLNASRVGHAYGLVKHPFVIELIRAKKIAVELNPISNQLLGLVSDLRNHAVGPLMAENIPTVISSDDPSAWEAAPLSHDMYVAFMDMTGEDADLTILKQLAINSIQYSAMNSTEKEAALKLWQSKWDKFVNDMIKTWNLTTDPHDGFAERVCKEEPSTSSSPSTSTELYSVFIYYSLLSLAYIFFHELFKNY